jgi:formate dehydrogenase subunit gamma
VHWVHASAFLVLLGTGLCLYLPSLAEVVGRRPLVKTIHLYTAIAWAVALVLVFVLGDRRALRQPAREIDRFDANDRAWLRRQPAPQGRLNAGQKLNAIVTAAFAILFAVSGIFLWLGERNTRFRLPQALLVHDWLMDVSVVLFAGHLFLALVYPRTRHALSGMTRGFVDESWALEHHRTWAEGLARLREAGAVVDGRGDALDAGPELVDESLRAGRSAGLGGGIPGR